MGSVSLINGHIDDDMPRMTPQEAIEKIKWIMQNNSHNKELCNICIEALEKQIPKKPIEDGYYDEPCVCPNCGSNVINEADNDYLFKHCYHCGQALDWSDTEE